MEEETPNSPESKGDDSVSGLIHRFLDASQAMVKRSVSLETAVNHALSEQLKRWRRAAIIIGLGFLMIITILLLTLVQSKSNGDVLVAVDETLSGVNSLVSFVEDAKEREAHCQKEPLPEDCQSGTQAAISAIFKINEKLDFVVITLCTIDDPTRLQYCREQGIIQ